MKHDSFFMGTRKLAVRSYRLIIALVSLFLLLQFVSLYLSWPKQILLGVVSIATAIILNRVSRSHIVTIGLMILSLVATLRYGWWRVHTIIQFFADESNNRLTIDAFLMLVLLSAEAYTILVMILGFMQTSSPLRRKPIPLPADESLWPHVDVLIPTYNEPLSLVRYTALAANNIDYPPEKLHVYILDDGTRDSFRDFAKEIGIGYVTRKIHDHAKAGNINHALKQMNSELVTIFDCDHVPTRSFLQVTVGWFLAQQKLGMLQTPHHFYSPDPFERNLLRYKTIPNEGELFYGIIQDGNDLWNATFFCGSCAVIRRSALNEVGGIATETVTEDAHTSLRIQKRGWNTAYINLPQAAGLATETLSAHVGQRVRWARGMVQILRTDNPLLASGMKFTQRLCYFNAMLHFMYAVPRIIFLCAPLIYMLAGRTIIPGYWVAILAYAMPHLFISSLTNSRVQGRHRHSFWNEIYETVLAPYIFLPTLLALINPKLGKFNVTDKGSTLSETQYDHSIAAPTTFLLALNLLGVCVAPYRFMFTDRDHPGTVLSNLIWILFNMVILGVAAAVANEQQQRRRSVRIAVKIPIRLHPAKGEPTFCLTTDMSVGGAALHLADHTNFSLGEKIKVSFPMQTGEATIPAIIVAAYDTTVRLEFDSPNLAEQETLTRALYSRADSWIAGREVEVDKPMRSLGRVIRLSFTGFHQILSGLMPAKKLPPTAKKALLAAAAGMLLLAALTHLAAAQTSQFPGVAAPISKVHPTPEAPKADDQPQPQAAQPEAPQAPVAKPAVTLFTPLTEQVTNSTANYRITFKDMGVQDFVPMHGPHSYYSLGFVLENSRIPRNATLNLSYHFNPALLPHTGAIKVSLNNTPIAEIAAPEQPQQDGEYASVALPLPAESLIRDNQLTFEFTGGTTLQLQSTARSLVLADIGASSQVLIVGERIPFKSDLSLLPLPIFDPDLQTTSTIGFVFLTNPSPSTLQAAAIVASWLGILTSTKPIHYTVAIGSIPRGNIILFNNHPGAAPESMNIPSGTPSLNIGPNPADPDSSALTLSGDDDDQLLIVARSLSLMTVASSHEGLAALGQSVAVGDFDLPAPREPDDAPRWLQTGRLTSLWDLSSRQALKADGSKTLPVYFRVPPDLNYGETQNLNLRLAYQYNAKSVAPGSAIRVFVNGSLLHEVPMPPGSGATDNQRNLVLPTAYMRPFGNTMRIDFDFIPKNHRPDRQSASDTLSGAILENSFLDLRGLAHRVKMPNLEIFANAGFPFTRRADLAETVVIMPVTSTPGEIALLLYLMSHCGMQTGYPALRVEISGPATVMQSDRDYLVLGNASDQPAFSSLASHLPITLDSDGIQVTPHSHLLSRMLAFRSQLLGSYWPQFQSAPEPSREDGVTDMLIEGIESPFYAGRSIITIAMRDDAAVDQFAQAFFERSQSSDIAHSVSLLREGKFSSFALQTPEYHVGYIAAYPLMRLWLAENFWLLFAVVTVLSLALATYFRDYLALLSEARLAER